MQSRSNLQQMRQVSRVFRHCSIRLRLPYGLWCGDAAAKNLPTTAHASFCCQCLCQFSLPYGCIQLRPTANEDSGSRGSLNSAAHHSAFNFDFNRRLSAAWCHQMSITITITITIAIAITQAHTLEGCQVYYYTLHAAHDMHYYYSMAIHGNPSLLSRWVRRISH